ncbi:MAG: hypothetical protein WBD51_01595, partial [Burkholderiaceae bacterium]
MAVEQIARRMRESQNFHLALTPPELFTATIRTGKALISAIALCVVSACSGPSEPVAGTQLLTGAARGVSTEFLMARVSAGSPAALSALGSRYLFGIDAPKRPEEGLRLIQLAAEQGWPEAQYRLGAAYY